MDPLARFRRWYREAGRAGLKEPDAMVCATADRRGRPSARFVLVKSFDARGFAFCTQSTSRKARELRENPRLCLLFYWGTLGRQVRIEGPAEEIPRAEAEAEWAKRPRESRLAGLASRQSRRLASRAALVREFRRLEREHRGREVPCPAAWTGFRVRPDAIEFWTRGPHRLHHRELFEKRGGRWRRALLHP